MQISVRAKFTFKYKLQYLYLDLPSVYISWDVIFVMCEI